MGKQRPPRQLRESRNPGIPDQLRGAPQVAPTRDSAGPPSRPRQIRTWHPDRAGRNPGRSAAWGWVILAIAGLGPGHRSTRSPAKWQMPLCSDRRPQVAVAGGKGSWGPLARALRAGGKGPPGTLLRSRADQASDLGFGQCVLGRIDAAQAEPVCLRHLQNTAPRLEPGPGKSEGGLPKCPIRFRHLANPITRAGGASAAAARPPPPWPGR
jgi:hypothetical protein